MHAGQEYGAWQVGIKAVMLESPRARGVGDPTADALTGAAFGMPRRLRGGRVCPGAGAHFAPAPRSAPAGAGGVVGCVGLGLAATAKRWRPGEPGGCGTLNNTFALTCIVTTAP